jgi:hypothetical protein
MRQSKSNGASLTERDTRVVLDLYKHRYLSVSQIKLLHFPSHQTAYRRLRALLEVGLIKGFTVPNIPEHIYYLAEPGAALVAESLGVALSDLKWNQASRAPKDYYFLRHFLKINDFRIALHKACRSSDISLLGFIPEYYGESAERGVPVKYIKDFICDITKPGAKLSHTPDGVFALAKNQAAALFFLEIDRGTEVVSSEEKGVLKAARFYLNYLASAGYQRYREDFGCEQFKGFRALVVTTSDARVENMRKAISGFNFVDKAKKFIWLTTDRQIDYTTIFQPIWLSADSADQTRYRIG